MRYCRLGFVVALLALISCGAAPRTATPIPAATVATATARPTATLRPTLTIAPLPTRDPNLDPAGVAPLNKDNCPDAYPIKGNVRDDGEKLYHLKRWPSYVATDPERCFATIEDAAQAGFRAAR